jgi:hypothetical protein
MTLRTWHFESAFALAVLSGVALASGGGAVEWIGAAAVFCSFRHGIIADRMAERQAVAVKPDVHCWRLAGRYFVAKELLWVGYFVAHRSYAALVGCGLFLAYPAWRKLWRRWHPIAAPWVGIDYANDHDESVTLIYERDPNGTLRFVREDET